MERSNRIYYLASIVALVTFAVYLPSLRNDFTGWDDTGWVVENPHLRSLSASFFRWAFLDFYRAYWCPLTCISFAIDHRLWGNAPVGYHLTNTLLHAANSYLVVWLIARLLMFRRISGTGERPVHMSGRSVLIVAGTVGALFGLHPLHVESVAWITERKDVLCAFFFLLSLIAYDHFIRHLGSAAEREPGKTLFLRKYPFLAGLSFVLALLSKPMAVSLPLVFLILDWYPYGRLRSLRDARAMFTEKLPFFALSAVSVVLTLLAQATGGGLSMMQFTSWTSRILIAASTLIVYLWKVLFPVHLMPYYPYPDNVSLRSGEYLLAAALVGVITIVSVSIIKKQKVWLSVWIYYVITLLPVLGIIQAGNQAMADRFMYLPSLGPFLLVGLATAQGVERLYAGKAASRPFSRMTLFILAGLLLASLSLLTMKQIGIWKNGITLWSSVIEQVPARAYRAYNNRGFVYLRTGQFGKAVDDYTEAIEKNASYDEAYLGRGQAFQSLGQIDRAINDLTMAIALKPGYYEAYNSRGIAFQGQGKFGKAIADYSQAIALHPSDPRIYNNRATAFYRTGALERALDDYTRSLDLEPSSPKTYLNRSLVLKKMGRFGPALEDCTRALALDPSFSDAYLNRGSIYLRMMMPEPAIADFQKACALGSMQGCSLAQAEGPR